MALVQECPNTLSAMSSLKRFWVTLIVVLTLSTPTPASAHPDLVLYIDTAANIRNQGQQLFVDYYIAKSQQFSFSEIAKLNGDLTAYANSECLSAVQNLKLSTGDFDLPLQLRSFVALENVVQTGAGAWIWCQFETEVRFYEVVEFSWQDLNYSGVDGHREFNLGKGTSPSKDLTDYSAIPTLLTQLETQFILEFPAVAEVEITEGVVEEEVKEEVEEAIGSEVVDEVSEPLAETESRKEFIESNRDDSRSWITKLSDRYFRSLDPTPIIVLIGSILAFILGAFHSVAPGHGKSIMAVLALAEHGRRREIYRLGVTMGATHTLGVFILGGLFIFGSNLVPQRTIPILGIISGTLIIAIGAFYLTKFIKHAQEHRHGHEDHHHHDDGVSGGRIALLGVVGGMVPTPTALTVLVGTAALGSAWYGILLVASYGVGMTLVLIFAGRLIESLYRYGESMVDSRSTARFVVERAPAIAATIQVIAGFFLVVISYGALI
jgi:ABC-type nickel/cobalt efflux system permease component RcnA